jgi:hypothetical protein
MGYSVKFAWREFMKPPTECAFGDNIRIVRGGGKVLAGTMGGIVYAEKEKTCSLILQDVKLPEGPLILIPVYPDPLEGQWVVNIDETSARTEDSADIIRAKLSGGNVQVEEGNEQDDDGSSDRAHEENQKASWSFPRRAEYNLRKRQTSPTGDAKTPPLKTFFHLFFHFRVILKSFPVILY